MSKQSIKQTIDDNIYQNGQQRITGVVMNSVLKEMVDNEYTELNQLASKVDGNSTKLEVKVNALLDSVKYLIEHVVFHSGTPYPIPSELMSALQLDRINQSSDKAICGTAICGIAICGKQ